jgi:hypothetical protein
LATIGILAVSLCILQPVQAQYYADGTAVEYYVGPLSIESPMNITYTTNRICLNFTVNAHFDPNVANVTMVYSLDSKDNVTVPTSAEYVPLWVTDENGNPTDRPSALFSYYIISGFAELEVLSSGSHSLSVFARYDDHGRKLSYFDDKTIYFTMANNFTTEPPNNSTTTPLNNNTTYVLVGGVIVLVGVALCIFAYQVRRKKQALRHNNH